MKNQLFFTALLCLLPFFLEAQPLNATYSDGHFGLINSVIPTPDGQWLFTGYRNNRAFVGGHANQNLHFDRVFFFEENEQLITGSVLNTSNIVYDATQGAYYWAVSANYCDYGVANNLFFFSEDLSTLPLAYELPADFATRHQIAAAAEGEVLILQSNGQNEGELSFFRAGELTHLHRFNFTNHEVLHKLKYWHGDYCLLLTDHRLELGRFSAEQGTYSTLASLTTSGSWRDLLILNDTSLLAATTDNLLVLGPGLDTLQSIANRIGADRLAQDETAIYLLSRDSLQILDHQFEEIAVYPTNELRNYQVLDMRAQGGQLAIVGTFRPPFGYDSGYSLRKPPSTLFVKTFSHTGSDLAPTTDVALSELTATRVNIINSPFDPGCASATAEGLHVLVTNEGSAVLESVTLAASQAGCELDFPICPLYYHYDLGTYAVNLAPGASTRVQIGEVQLGLLDAGRAGRLCVYGFAERGTLEANTDNNRSCMSAVVVGTETVADAPEWRIWPNPATDQLSLSLPAGSSPTETLAIYGTNGQLVFQAPADGPLDISTLAPGVYQLVLLESRLRKTFVKQ